MPCGPGPVIETNGTSLNKPCGSGLVTRLEGADKALLSFAPGLQGSRSVASQNPEQQVTFFKHQSRSPHSEHSSLKESFGSGSDLHIGLAGVEKHSNCIPTETADDFSSTGMDFLDQQGVPQLWTKSESQAGRSAHHTPMHPN